MKAFLVGNRDAKIDDIAAAQLSPFFDNRNQLKNALKFDFTHIQAVTLGAIQQAIDTVNRSFDLLFVRPCWREQPDQVVELLARTRHANPNAKIIFIDPWDQENTRYFGVLPYVDWFIKYQALKNVDEYKRDYQGGTIVTDFLARELGYDLNGWHVGSKVPDGYENRIISGWSLGVSKQFKDQLFQHPFWNSSRKEIDICCHVSIGSKHNLEWYGQYRQHAVEVLRSLAPEYKLAVSAEYNEARTVSGRQYRRDMKRSRIIFSPFGWGPLTWRDYEAVLNRALLIKPCLDCLDAKPNIFIAGETYAPVKWDLSDLVETCRYYLQHPEERERIIANARQAYKAYFQGDCFVDTIAKLVQNAPVAVEKVS